MSDEKPISQDSDGPLLDGPALDADGRLHGELPPRRAPELLPAPRKPAPQKLELDERKLRHAFGPVDAPKALGEVYRDPAYRLRRRRVRMALVAIALCAVAAFAIALYGEKLTRRLGAHASASLLVDSQPGGAEIYVDGQLVGQTPWAGNNDFGPGKHKLRLAKSGFEPFMTEIAGGKEAAVSARLRAR